jgi:hypothetical protein
MLRLPVLLLLSDQCTCWLHNLPMLLLLLQLHAPMLLPPTGTIAVAALYNSCCSSISSKRYNSTSASAVPQAAVCICTV